MLLDQHLAGALPGIGPDDVVILQIEVATRPDCFEYARNKFSSVHPQPLSPVRPASGRVQSGRRNAVCGSFDIEVGIQGDGASIRFRRGDWRVW